ncbi:serine/arginine repetitive matrix protein 1-like [Triticum dicoccoides]|uniref:serine/arginine repetitive matrix protein 1-like n=1 Tax=Triticum dicoccoides TaxID=85692 RepID=UPI000E7BA46A|nr:serine/arginine repetitive matrix protein 1-like [Triticum dicoccoides]
MEAMAAKGSPKPVPNYLRPSTGSCHDACKHGGHHAFEEKQAPRAQPKPRKKQQPSASDDHKTRLVKVRSVSRRRVGDFSKPDKADTPAGGSEIVVEWKDIVAYDAAPVPVPAPASPDGPSHQQPDGRNKRDVKGKAPFAKATHPEKQTESLNKRLAKTVRSTLTGKASVKKPQAATNSSPSHKKGAGKPPKAKKSATLPVENKEIVQGDATHNDVKQGKSLYTPDQEERAAIALSMRPILAPAHRRAKSMSISNRSVRFPFTRQPSNNSATFKLRSKSSKAPILPSEQDKPTRLRFRKGRAAGEESSGGIQLRARSLRRRGSSMSGSATGFIVPEVMLRHQKTLERKKSRRLSNNLIEETASKLAKSRKSRVKSLVGAFETLFSKIGK